ncbi:hypothetical protein JTE90_027714 [Oedothorax gibbosus]|uniref:GLTSCR protein conserved domain-containing protein n=1 Tax=Oedothorax gibbosus TaxID=931172 RepID=A0AAV6UUE7_9ARAC|nr:hypothetical protein JTE90_027714 [Oedothorax gibbosus]
MYNNVLEPNEYPRHFLSDHNMSCSFAMDDGGRCLLDVINDPKLLQSFLESGSDENSKDPQDGTSSESAVESPQVSRSSHSTLANHQSSAEQHVVDQADQMGYSYVDGQLLAQRAGMSLIVAASTAAGYQHASTSGGTSTIHHHPSVSHSNLHPQSPRSVTPVNIKSPAQGPSSVHSMPPPSPLGQTRSPLPSHTPSPAPVWSPAPPVLSPATSRTQQQPVAFQQHNQVLQTSCSVTQFVTALATQQQSIAQKLTLQQQQQLFLQQATQQQSSPRLAAMQAPVVTTAAVPQPVVQLIHTPPSNARTAHSVVRPIQPKQPPQILPKPATCAAPSNHQFVPSAPAPKQAPPTPVTTAHQRTATVGMGLQHGAPGQLLINQGQPGVFQGPQGTILLNQIIPGMGQSPILIQGNLSNLANIPGLQLTLRPPSSPSPGQSLSSSNPQNNATLIAALQGPSQHAQTLFTQAKSPIHGQPTIVIPNNLAHAHPGLAQQNINLTSAGLQNSGIISSSNSQGQSFLTRSNIILSPRVVGGNQSLQLQQIQTPNGPILAFAPSQTITVPHLGNAQLPMHGVMATGQGVISGLSLQSHAPQSALQHQSLFGTAVPFTSHLEQSSPQVIQVPQPMAPPNNHPGHIQNQHQQQQIDHSPKPASPPKPSKVPSVNLEELLKEHGIVPENSPVPSPECPSPVMEEPVPAPPIIPSPQQQILQALQSQQVLLEQSQGPNPLSQLKLSLTQDGSFILHQPHGPLGNSSRIQHFVSSSGHLHTRTVNNNNTVSQVIFPTHTTSVPASAEPNRGHSTLIARLNAGPAINVPDVASLALTSCNNTITTSATTLVPSTVQSTSSVVTSAPIASSYIVQRTNTPSDRLYIAEDIVQTSQSLVQSRPTPVISTSTSTSCSPTQKMVVHQHHNNSTFQTHVVPNNNSRTTVQQTAHVVPNNTRTTVQQMTHVVPNNTRTTVQQMTHVVPNNNSRTTVQQSTATIKTVQSTVRATSSIAAKNSSSQQNVQFDMLLKGGQREMHLVEVAHDNGTSAVPSHNHAAFPSNVPNHMLLRVQKEIQELGLLKTRNVDQQKVFNQLVNAQQKLMSPLQNKSKASRANQNQLQLKIESEVEKLLQRSLACRTAVINENHHLPPQLPQPPKAPVLAAPQQNVPTAEKNQTSNVKVVNSHNLHLVNLLKQNSPHSTPVVRHIAPPTTTITTACDSTTPTITAPSNVQNIQQKQCNQVNPPPLLPRLPAPHPQNTTTKPVNEAPQQQQVIVRLQKPVQQTQQPVQNCPTSVQIKVLPPPNPPPPVKRVVNTVPKTVLIKEQLSKDHTAVLTPDTKKPFQSKEDACRRLLQYHVFNNSRDPTWTELQEDDRKFTERSKAILNRIDALTSKYRLLQMENSMRLGVTPDRVLMERLFIADEKEALQADRDAVAEGKYLDLPPPPASWLPKLRAQCRSPTPPPIPPPAPSVVIKEEIPSDTEDQDQSSNVVYKNNDCTDRDLVYKDSNCGNRDHSDRVYKDDCSNRDLVFKDNNSSNRDQVFKDNRDLVYKDNDCRNRDLVFKDNNSINRDLVYKDNDSRNRELSDPPVTDDSDPVYKDEDNLEAPVIDSCEDIAVPHHDDNCERSPPTLKRIVIKPSSWGSESSDPEDLMPSRKRLKFNNNVVVINSQNWSRTTAKSVDDWSRTVAPKHSDKSELNDWGRTSASTNKHSDKSELNDWDRTSALTNKHSDKSELNDWSQTSAPTNKHSDKSELNNWNRTSAPTTKHVDKSELNDWGRTSAPTNKHSDKSELNDWGRTSTPTNKHSDTNNKDLDGKANHKFPLVTREFHHSDNSRIDDMVFDMSPMEIGEDSTVDFEPPVPRTEESNLFRSNCVDKYDFDLLTSDWTEQYQSESDMPMIDHPSDLDLSGLEGLDEHLENDDHLPNGTNSDLNNICYLIPSKHSSRQNSQVQSAVKSITGENRSYFDTGDFHHRHNHYGGGGAPEMTPTPLNNRAEHDLDEAVRSILL